MTGDGGRRYPRLVVWRAGPRRWRWSVVSGWTQAGGRRVPVVSAEGWQDTHPAAVRAGLAALRAWPGVPWLVPRASRRHGPRWLWRRGRSALR